MPKVILVATTSASDSDEFSVVDEGGGRSSMPALFTCPGLAGSETGTLYKKNESGSFVECVLNIDEHIISTTRFGVVAYAPGIYRVEKSVTASAVSIEVSTSILP